MDAKTEREFVRKIKYAIKSGKPIITDAALVWQPIRTVDEQLELDLQIYGCAFYTKDEDGTKHRIDPTQLEIMV